MLTPEADASADSSRTIRSTMSVASPTVMPASVSRPTAPMMVTIGSADRRCSRTRTQSSEACRDSVSRPRRHRSQVIGNLRGRRLAKTGPAVGERVCRQKKRAVALVG
jgi:hypothetical protein